MIKYLIAFMLFSSPCLAGMGIGGFPQPGPGVVVVVASAGPTFSDDFSSDTSANYITVGSDAARGIIVTSGSSYGAARWQWNIVIRGSVSANHYAQASIKYMSGDSSGIVLGANSPGATSTGYIVRPSSDTRIRLMSFSGNNEPITRGEWTVDALASDTYHSIKAVKTGDTFAVYLNGTHLTPDVTDTTYTGGTYAGLVFDRSNGATPIPTVDNFEAGQ